MEEASSGFGGFFGPMFFEMSSEKKYQKGRNHEQIIIREIEKWLDQCPKHLPNCTLWPSHSLGRACVHPILVKLFWDWVVFGLGNGGRQGPQAKITTIIFGFNWHGAAGHLFIYSNVSWGVWRMFYFFRKYIYILYDLYIYMEISIWKITNLTHAAPSNCRVPSAWALWWPAFRRLWGALMHGKSVSGELLGLKTFTPWKINMVHLQITHLERKMIFQPSMIMFHVNLPGCTLSLIIMEVENGSLQFFSMRG